MMDSENNIGTYYWPIYWCISNWKPLVLVKKSLFTRFSVCVYSTDATW